MGRKKNGVVLFCFSFFLCIWAIFLSDCVQPMGVTALDRSSVFITSTQEFLPLISGKIPLIPLTLWQQQLSDVAESLMLIACMSSHVIYQAVDHLCNQTPKINVFFLNIECDFSFLVEHDWNLVSYVACVTLHLRVNKSCLLLTLLTVISYPLPQKGNSNYELAWYTREKNLTRVTK